MRRLVPNALTVLRLGLLPFLAYALHEGKQTAAVSLLAVAVLSDGLDGFLARRWHAETRFGRFVDPLADKLTQATVLFLLALDAGPVFTRVPLWLPLLIGAKDVWLAWGALRIRARHGRVEIQPLLPGKLSTLCVFSLTLLACLGGPPAVVVGLSFAAAFLAGLATAIYTVHGRRQWARAGLRSRREGPRPSEDGA